MQLFQKMWQKGMVTELLRAGDPAAAEFGRVLERRITRLFGRALAIREVVAGSCNGCELEITRLASPIYDMERFGMHFVASPRHADMLLVTGPVMRNMEIPLRRSYEAAAVPKFVVAVGDCAKSCGVFKDSYAVVGPVDRIIPVDISIAGCPPDPTAIVRGILEGLDRFSQKREPTAPTPCGGGRLMALGTLALIVMVFGFGRWCRSFARGAIGTRGPSVHRSWSDCGLRWRLGRGVIDHDSISLSSTDGGRSEYPFNLRIVSKAS